MNPPSRPEILLVFRGPLESACAWSAEENDRPSILLTPTRRGAWHFQQLTRHRILRVDRELSVNQAQARCELELNLVLAMIFSPGLWHNACDLNCQR